MHAATQSCRVHLSSKCANESSRGLTTAAANDIIKWQLVVIQIGPAFAIISCGGKVSLQVEPCMEGNRPFASANWSRNMSRDFNAFILMSKSVILSYYLVMQVLWLLQQKHII